MACSETGHPCVYSESEKRVTVTESYLLELRAQARRAELTQQGGDYAAEPGGASSQEIELRFTGTENWVLDGPGQYRGSTLTKLDIHGHE